MTRVPRRRAKAVPSQMVHSSEHAQTLVGEPVIEIYDALAKDYAEHYESGNPDRLFLDEFLEPPEKGLTASRPGPRNGKRGQVFLRSWHASRRPRLVQPHDGG